MQVPDYIVETASNNAATIVEQFADSIFNRLRDELGDPYLSLCVIQTIHKSMIEATVNVLDPVAPESLKLSTHPLFKMFELSNEVIRGHVQKITLSSMVSDMIDKSSEQN